VKYILVFLLAVLALTGCKKNESESIFIDEQSDKVVRYVIHLSGSTITEYETFVNDTLKAITKYFFSDSLVKVIRYDTSGKMTGETVYTLDSFGLADSSVERSFSGKSFSISKTMYDYSDRFLVKKTTFRNSSDTWVSVVVNRTIEDENVVEVELNDGSLNSNIYYWYNEKENKIDLNFSNGITGKWSKNLVKHISWNNQCSCGQSMTIPKSDYSYELDANGYVTKKVETYTPSYNLPPGDKVIRTITTTLYEYKLN